jgi:1-acyl-sn-glycerol-3-phosphate acyltransferase
VEVHVKDLLYRLLAECFQAFIWGGDVAGDENLPEQGPAVLVANHLGALGPIAVVSCVPRRLYPWVHADVMDAERAPEYLRWDFVEKELHLTMPFSLWLAKTIAKISVPLLNRTGCIPVHTNPKGLLATFDQSVDLLTRGRFVVVFPEDPTQPPDPKFGMSPFKKGFVRLGELYFQGTGRSLKFYPLAVHAIRRTVQVGKPVTYNPYAPPVKERIRIKNALESMIREMLIGKDGNFYLRVPLPH